jgi:UDP-glucuronate 4-epimerase
MKILITGAAGFIGMHTVQKFAFLGYEIIALDNINSYYETDLKYARLAALGIERNAIVYNKLIKGHGDNISFIQLDIQDAGNLNVLFATQNFDIVIHLAAQAGVRYSITNPRDYIDSNIIGFYTILEACRNFEVQHLLFASSSSVYGDTETIPFSENQNTDSPVSFYAATKKSNEVMAHAYASLYELKITGLRFFTVYGPWGRPDMAPVLFAKAGTESQPIKVFNNGEQSRDFTYIDDIVQGIVLVAENKSLLKNYQILNIGKGSPVSLMDFIRLLEKELNLQFDYDFMPPQKGDVITTYSNTSEIEKLGYKASTPLEIGIPKFVEWFKDYYNITQKF